MTWWQEMWPIVHSTKLQLQRCRRPIKDESKDDNTHMEFRYDCLHVGHFVLPTQAPCWQTFSAPGVPYMWVMLCSRRKHHTNKVGNVGTRWGTFSAPGAQCSELTRGHQWAIPAPRVAQSVNQEPLVGNIACLSPMHCAVVLLSL